MNSTSNRTAGLSPEEKRALLARLLREKAASGRPADAGVHRLFEAQAALRPEASALVFDGIATPFGELNARANRLARRLRGIGVGPETLVGLCVDRSPEMIVGLLAILKAGGAYLPLDPNYPASRLGYMLEDAGVPVVLTTSALAASIPTGEAFVARIVEDDRALGAENLEGVSSPDHRAYVIYTSGSTGEPKGVEVQHGSLGNFLRSMTQVLGFGRDDALLAVTTLSFDIAALELLLPLTTGGRIELAGREEASDGIAIARRIEAAGVSFLQATPATWRLLLEAGWPGSGSLTMLCGGEALPRSLADRLLPKGSSLWNLYGPTETTIWSSAGRVEPGEGSVVIGKPIANTQLYVLDPHSRPVPMGIVGELHIGGSGLARGYLGRPGLTAERFIPDGFGPKGGGRLYRTGDLARWHADGSLECLGRVDHQVKIRGFRVELGEVESALLRHPDLREAVVVAREDSTGEQALVAYLVARGAQIPPAADLRRSIQGSLPDYMVPTHFVALDALPLTPNGKVDRNALPAPEASRAAPSGYYVPPRSAIEEAVASAFGDVLGIERVGALDDFFDLGGHSLMAAQLVARLRDAFGREIPLRDLFDAPTVSALSHRIGDALRAGSGEVIPAIEPVNRAAPLPASFAQQRLWFLDQLEPGQTAYNLPLAVRLIGELDPEIFRSAVDELIRRHESLRTTFDAIDGQPIQVIAPRLSIPVPLVDLISLPEAGREPRMLELLALDNRKPFDLARGPLIRASIVRLGPTEHVVSVAMHHIISDGWSINVLVRDLAAIYDAFSRDQPSPLPPLTVHYADHAAWQRRWLQGDALTARLEFWTRHLAGLPNLELPTDRPRLPVRVGRGGSRMLAVPAELATSLRALGRQESATAFMAMLASFQVLLARYSGQDDIAVGSPIAGRTRSEVEDLIGFFANTVVFRGDLKGDPSFRVLLGRTKTAVLEALGHQDLPFDQLVTALRPERDPSRTPVFQVMFAFHQGPTSSLGSGALAMEPIHVGGDTARADLTMFLLDRDDRLSAEFEYDSDLFDAATIDRMLGHWRTLLESIVAEPDRPISTLTMLSEDEQRRLIGRWDDRDEAQPTDLDGLSEEELDAMLQQLEAGHDA